MVKRIGIIGLGNVGSMLLDKIIELNLFKENEVYVANRSKEKLDKTKEKYTEINICNNNVDLVNYCRNIIVCVEPLNLPGVLFEVKQYLNSNTYLMISTSMVAHEDIYKMHQGKITIFMPTLISLVNDGVTLAYHNEHIENDDKNLFNEIMEKISEVNVLAENDIKLAQNLTASFPGFFAEIMLEFVKSVSNKSKNLSIEELEHMLLVSLKGAARLLLEENMSFEETINRVSTKGGITYEGVQVYKNKLPEVFQESLKATVDRYEVITEKARVLIDNILKEINS